MSFFIQSAHAAAETAPATFGGTLLQMLPMILIFVAFYFLLLRPQAKRNKEHKNMINALSVGNEVVFAGGLMGVVEKIDGDYMVVALNKNNQIKVQKASVISVLPKGTLDNI